MRRRRADIVLLAVLALFVAACSKSENGSNDNDNEPSGPVFGTADAENLVTDTVAHFDLNDGTSGPTTAIQALGDFERTPRWEELGYEMGWTNEFAISSLDPTGQKPPTVDKSTGATFFFSSADLFPDSGKAAEALDFIKETSPPGLEDRETTPEPSLGEGAFKVSSSVPESPEGAPGANNLGYRWRVENAILALNAQSLTDTKPVEGKVLALTTEMNDQAKSVDPTGESLALPPEDSQPSDEILSDDFSNNDTGWLLQFPGESPELAGEIKGGTFNVHITKPGGGRFNDTTELKDPKLAKLSGVSVSADVASWRGDHVFAETLCRVVKDTGFYVAEIGVDGTALLFQGSYTGPAEILVRTSPNEELAPTLADGFNIRSDCVGDDMVRISLYVDDEKIADVLDDDPLPAGGAGFGLESGPPGGAVSFDSLVINSIQ